MTFYPIRIYSWLGEQRQTEVSNKGDRRQAASRPPVDRGGDGDTLVSRTLRFALLTLAVSTLLMTFCVIESETVLVFFALLFYFLTESIKLLRSLNKYSEYRNEDHHIIAKKRGNSYLLIYIIIIIYCLLDDQENVVTI